jgi:hypothetical protein
MTASTDLERRLADFYAAEAASRAPEWVLNAALSTVTSTAQRRAPLGVPRRFNRMNSFAKLAIAAVVAIAVGAVGLAVLRPAGAPGPGVGGNISPSPSAPPSPSPAPTAPPLTGSFTSPTNGISISYPAGWATSPATEQWTTTGVPNFVDPFADHLYDPALTDHLFLSLASQPLGSTAAEAWTSSMIAGKGECGAPVPVSVDGTVGVTGTTCNLVAVAVGGRGYLIAFYTSADDAGLGDIYDEAYYNEILATVQLLPEDAAPAPSSSQ